VPCSSKLIYDEMNSTMSSRPPPVPKPNANEIYRNKITHLFKQID